MPELPEAEYMVRRLAEFAPQVAIRRVRILRDSSAEPNVARHGRGRVASYARRAKNVLLHLDTGWTLRIQLGMTGHVYWIADARHASRFTRVLLELEGGEAIAFEDARVFGSMEAHRTATLPEVFVNYGPEPLDATFRWQALAASLANRRSPIKPLLLDQSLVAGLGNIWAAEALFQAHIHPARPAASLDTSECRRLHAAIRRVLTRAIANTLRVTSRPEEFPEADLLSAAVYGRAGQRCRRCPTAIMRTVQAGRSTFFCPRCQQ